MPITQILLTANAGGGSPPPPPPTPAADFTIEWWQKVENNSTNARPWSVGLYPTQKLAISYESMLNDYFWINDSYIMTTVQSHIGAGWRHVAYVRSSGVVRGYIDGTQYTGNIDNGSLITDTATPFYVGTGEIAAGTYKGYITDLHVMKGVAKYTSNFTPPTTYQLTGQTGSVFLLPANGAGSGFDTIGGKSPASVTGTVTASPDVPFAAQSPVVTNVLNPFNITNSELFIDRTLTPAIDNVQAGWTFVSANYAGTVTSSVIGLDETYRNITLSITSGAMDNSTGTFSPPTLTSYYFDGSSYFYYNNGGTWAMDL